MKEGEEKDIDLKFREGLTNPEDHIVYNDADWDAMETLLNEQRRSRGKVLRFPFMLGAAAAMILMALGLYFFWPVDNKPENLTSIKRRPSADSITFGKSTVQQEPKQEIAKRMLPKSNTEVDDKTNMILSNRQQEIKAAEAKKARYAMSVSGYKIKRVQHKSNAVSISRDEVEDKFKNLLGNPEQQTIASVYTDTNAHNTQPAPQQALLADAGKLVSPQTDTPNVAPKNIEKDKKTKKLSLDITGPKHPIVLSIIGAPDFNGVGSAFNRTQIGTNVGLLLSVGVNRKLFISTGAVYARKPYSVGMDKYKTSYQFSNQPNDVSADCRVLDIPLNIDYQVYNKGANLFRIGTGLSTYFMLRENYHFNYNQSYVGPSDYNISNQNKHILGVVNLNATYQRRINSKFGLNVQPYMKLPITDIGYGRVNLKSAGVAVGASWYLNTSATKK